MVSPSDMYKVFRGQGQIWIQEETYFKLVCILHLQCINNGSKDVGSILGTLLTINDEGLYLDLKISY